MPRIDGSCTGSAASKYDVWIDYSVGNYSIEDNTTPVTATLKLRRNDGYSNSAWNRQSLSYAQIACDSLSPGTNSLYIDTRNNVVVTLASETFTVPHNSDGSKTIYLSGNFTMPGVPQLTGGSVSGSVTLPTIPRASTPNAPDLVIGDDLTISISRASSAFTHDLYLYAGSLDPVISGVGTSGTFTFSDADVAALYASLANSNTGSYGLVCVTYSGNTEVGRKPVYGTMRVVPSRAAPVFSAFDFSASRTDLTGDSSKIISGVSSVTVTIPVADKATSTTSASIVKYIASVGNATAEAPWSEDAYVYIEVPNAASGTVSVAAVDSRGNQTIVTKLGTLIPYTPPRVSSITTQRANSVDSAVSLQAQGVWDNKSFGLVTNTLSAQYRYKLTTAQEYSDPIAIALTINEDSWQFNDTISGDLGVDGFTITSSFDVLLEITDAVPVSGSGQSIVDRGIPTMHMTQDGISVGQMMPEGLPEGVVNAASGFSINGLVQDYMIESGNSGIWEYRKWASGVYECWGNLQVSSVNINNAWGGTYYGYTEGADFPIVFSELPTMTATVNGQTTTTVFLGTGSSSSWSKFSTSQTGAFVLLRGTSGTFSGIISIQAKGKWM